MSDHPDHPHDHQHAHGPTGPEADASVRQARPTDAPAVGTVQSAVWRDAFADLVPPQVLAAFEPLPFARAWRSSLEHPPSPRHLLAVSCAGPQVVGYAALGPCTDPDAEEGDGEVLDLGVHPDGREQGHGSRLLNAAVDLLREAGFTHCYVWVPAAHERTRAWLEVAGFAPDSAYRDRVVVEGDGEEPPVVLREVRLGVRISRPPQG